MSSEASKPTKHPRVVVDFDAGTVVPKDEAPLFESEHVRASSSGTPRPTKTRLARWYMDRIAGRYCPCEWPVKVRPLIRLCGRIDDEACRMWGR